MDGSTFVGMVEVTEDQFRGSLKLPLFNGPTMGPEWDAPARGEFPAGKRADWRKTMFGQPVATRIVTPTGTRYWVHSSIPIRTVAAAMAYLDASMDKARDLVMEQDRAAERRRAERRGMTVEEYRSAKAAEEMERRFARARRDREDERREIFNLPSPGDRTAEHRPQYPGRYGAVE